MRTLTTLALAATTALAATLGYAQEQSSPFTEAERAALHAEIRSYLLANPEIIVEVIQELEKRQAAEESVSDRERIAANAEAIFNDGFSFVAGNPEGSITIVEFLDYQCGYCRRAFPEVAELIEAAGDIRLVVKEFPILGPNSELAARAAIATLISAGPEQYEALHDRLMTLDGPLSDARLDPLLTELELDPATIRTTMDDPEVTRRISETRALGEQLGISGTPTFVVADQMVRGYVPLPQMEQLVAALRVAE